MYRYTKPTPESAAHLLSFELTMSSQAQASSGGKAPLRLVESELDEEEQKAEEEAREESEEQPKQPTTSVVVRLERRRKQTRVSQRRHRDRAKSREYNLVLDINQLKEEIARLERLRILMTHRPLNMPRDPHGSLVRTMRFYYDLFKDGMRKPTPEDTLDMQQTHQKKTDFFKWMCAPQVFRGEMLVDLEDLCEQWHRITEFYPGLDMQLLSCDVVNVDKSPILHVRSQLYFRIMRTTLENVFPHVLQNETLVQMILGQEMFVPIDLNYVFDEDNKVVSLWFFMDLASSFQRIVKRAEITSSILQGAEYTGNYMVGKWDKHKLERQLSVDIEAMRAHHSQQPEEEDALRDKQQNASDPPSDEEAHDKSSPSPDSAKPTVDPCSQRLKMDFILAEP